MSLMQTNIVPENIFTDLLLSCSVKYKCVWKFDDAKECDIYTTGCNGDVN